MPPARAALLLMICAGLCACSYGHRRAGVENRWRESKTFEFVEGKTREADVLRSMGPPSRIVPLAGRTVFYYALEDSRSVGLTLIVFNTLDTKVRYDRAVFFFDKDGVLEAWSLSAESLPREEPDS